MKYKNENFHVFQASIQNITLISRVTSIKFIYLHIDLSLRTELFKDGHNHIIQKLYNAKK